MSRPQYWEIYKYREVIGISLLFMVVDILGGVFSFLSLFFRNDLDIAAFVSFLICLFFPLHHAAHPLILLHRCLTPLSSCLTVSWSSSTSFSTLLPNDVVLGKLGGTQTAKRKLRVHHPLACRQFPHWLVMVL